MAHYTHKLSYTNMEEDICEILCLDLLFISDNTDCFSLDIEVISSLLASQIVEAEQKLELQADSSTHIRTELNSSNPNWKYNPVEVINLLHYCIRVYMTKTLRKCVIKCYHLFFQNPVCDRLDQTLNTVYRWLGKFNQVWKLCRTCKDCQSFKKRNSYYWLLPDNYAETLTPWNTVCVDLIDTYILLGKLVQIDNKILTQEL